jgi:hypothetical protein
VETRGNQRAKALDRDQRPRERADEQVAHTEAAFVVDAAGYQRAVFVYPFSAADVERELDIVG